MDRIPMPGAQSVSCYEVRPEGITCVGEMLTDADPLTFTPLSYTYAKDASHVYYFASKVVGADPESFEVFSFSPYAKDKGHVYYEGRMIPEADPKTFIVKDVDQAQDQGALYVRANRLIQADPSTFHQLDFWKTMGQVFADRKSVYCFIPSSQDNSWQVKVLDMDTSSLKRVFEDDLHYGLYEVFTNGQLVFFADCTVAREADLASFKKFPGQDAFAVYYGDALGHVYFVGRSVSGANGDAFKPLQGSFAKDDRQAYYEDKPLPGADVASFTTVCRSRVPMLAILESPQDTCSGIVGKDKNRIFDPLDQSAW